MCRMLGVNSEYINPEPQQHTVRNRTPQCKQDAPNHGDVSASSQPQRHNSLYCSGQQPSPPTSVSLRGHRLPKLARCQLILSCSYHILQLSSSPFQLCKLGLHRCERSGRRPQTCFNFCRCTLCCCEVCTCCSKDV